MNRVSVAAALIVLLSPRPDIQAQANGRMSVNPGADPHQQSESQSDFSVNAEGEQELQKGTALTRDGHFAEAIPHLAAARGRVTNEYAASFNLALCYVATGDYKRATAVLTDLRHGHDNADVENLLAQAYIGNGQDKDALTTVERAAAMSPQNEKLYVFVADSCTDHQDFALGLQIADLGLRNLPQSARLHYERGVLLANIDRLDEAKTDFELAAKLAPEGEIGYLSRAEQSRLNGDIAAAVTIAREGIAKGFPNPVLLTVLGEALLRSGIAPGQPEFAEAQSALEKSVAERPNDPTSQIALGQIELQAGLLDDAISHLEKARQMKPNQPAVYASLAKAYQRKGDAQRAQEALAALEKLNLARADQIRNAPGERKMSYAGTQGSDEKQQTPK
ncbi:MAG TPA: tetratricopeptide repeat protein [Verrucomicrobiae bacterium]|nr:tetratricopeptide repeat protein [Verrucomicrobiae bacterium]